MRDLSIIIVSYNTSVLTIDCLKSIYADKTGYDFKVWIVDNASTDGSAKKISAEFPQVNLIASQKNLGFAGGNNLALDKIKGSSKYYLFLNSDTLVNKGFLNTIIKTAQSFNYGITSCKLLNNNHTLQPNTGSLPKPLAVLVWLSGFDDILRPMVRIPSYHECNLSFYKGTKEVGWVSGSVMLVSNEVLLKVGNLDEKIFMYGEDVDYCIRTKKKKIKIGWTDSCSVIHLGGGSSKDPKLDQWLGEFKGIIYLYSKYYGDIPANLLKGLIKIFIILRIIVFRLIGRKEIIRPYAKIIENI